LTPSKTLHNYWGLLIGWLHLGMPYSLARVPANKGGQASRANLTNLLLAINKTPFFLV